MFDGWATGQQRSTSNQLPLLKWVQLQVMAIYEQSLAPIQPSVPGCYWKGDRAPLKGAYHSCRGATQICGSQPKT